jgi:Y_Y_Y domain/Histidine kinase
MHYHSNGVLYMSIEGKGLYSFDGHTLQHFDRSSGLMSESIYKISSVNNETLALFHSSGVIEMNVVSGKFRSALHQESNYHTFMKEAGISNGENGSLVYFYQNFIYDLDFNGESTNTSSTSPSVSGFRVFNSNRYNSLPPESIELKYSENFFTFSLSAFDFAKNNRAELSFILEGFDPDWRMSDASSEAAYTNVPAGKYVFKVRSRLPGDEWGTTRNYTVTIHPPFWQTWWFRILVVLAISAILYGIYRYRLAQILKLQAVRNKIASDLHDDVGSTLSSINIFSKFARDHLPKNPKETDELLKRINTSTVKMMDNMSDIVWSINPQNDTLKSLVLRIRSHAAEVLGSMGIKTEFDQVIDEDLQLNMTSRKNIFLITKEAINNIAKHSGASIAHLSFRVEKGNLMITIGDNGPEASDDGSINKGGNGAKTIRSRAKELDAEVEIAPSMKKIALQIPLKKIKL